jgi:hypothetical protein
MCVADREEPILLRNVAVSWERALIHKPLEKLWTPAGVTLPD